MKGPVFIVKPKNIFRHPFNKFDLDKPLNRDTQNEDLTDYFNYGFNEDTMNIYGKLVKRTIQVLDEGINPTYFDAASELMRLNDQIPMDFGGFCKFFDTSIFACPEGTEEQLEYMNNYYNGERLFNFFIYIATSKNQNASQYPLIDFVRCMYKNFLPEQLQMCDVMDQVEQNLQKKYQEMMKKLQDKKNNPGGTSTSHNASNQAHDKKAHNQNDGDITKTLNQNNKKQQDKQVKEESSQSQSSDSQSDDSSSDSDKKKKKNKTRSGRSKSRSRSNRKEKKSKNKTRKISKDRERKDRRKDKHKDKSKKKSRSRDRSRRKDKSKKRRS